VSKDFDFACSSAIKPIQNQETYPVQNVELDAAIVNEMTPKIPELQKEILEELYDPTKKATFVNGIPSFQGTNGNDVCGRCNRAFCFDMEDVQKRDKPRRCRGPTCMNGNVIRYIDGNQFTNLYHRCRIDDKPQLSSIFAIIVWS